MKKLAIATIIMAMMGSAYAATTDTTSTPSQPVLQQPAQDMQQQGPRNGQGQPGKTMPGPGRQAKGNCGPQNNRPGMMRNDHKNPNNRADMPRGAGGFFQSTNVANLKNLKDDQRVILTGQIEKQIDDNEFQFKDTSGSTSVKIGERAWGGHVVTQNQEVKLLGKVDKDGDKTEVKVRRVLAKPPKDTPPSMAPQAVPQQ